MASTSRTRWQAVAVAIAPAVMLAGFAYHPHIGDPLDTDFLARLGAAVAADPTRWAVAHYLVAVGGGLMMLALLAVRSYLREAGEDRHSAPAVPFLIMGSTLYALLPAMEFAPLAAMKSGADAAAAQGALLRWFAPTLLTSAVVFGVGAVLLSLGIAKTRLPSPAVTRLVAGALVVMAAARFVPLSVVQFYVQGVAGVVALWPLAYAMWTQPEASLQGTVIQGTGSRGA